LARGQRALEVHAAYDVTQRGDGQLVDCLEVVGELVRGRPRVGDLVVEHRIDVYHEVVLGDHRLRLRAEHLLADVELVVDPVDHREDEVQSWLQRHAVPPEALDVVPPRLRDDPHGGYHQEHHQRCRDDNDGHRGVHM